MKQVTSAEFRTGFSMYLEPVEVRRYTNVIGTWYPEGTESPVEEVPITTQMLATYRTEIEAQAEEIKQLKKMLAARSQMDADVSAEFARQAAQLNLSPAADQGFGRSRPAPKPVGKKK
jgi:hypothetical protein